MNYFTLLPESILMQIHGVYYTIDDESHYKIAILSQSYSIKEDVYINCRKLRMSELNQFVERLDDEVVQILWHKLEPVLLLLG